MATVLLLGASGFIGRHLLAALGAARHAVICGVRDRTKVVGHPAVEVDYTRDHDPAVWLPRLERIDVVINAVGILREHGAATFEALHVAAPRALFQACEQAQVRRVIQISALGADDAAVSRYHLTKKRADDFLAALSIPWVIVQPSLAYGEGGASARLFTTLASLPLVPLPGRGMQRVQPIHVDDLAGAVQHLVDSNKYDCQRIPAVGPNAVPLREMLATLRYALGLAPARFLPVPMPLVRLAAAVGDYLPSALLDRESLGMLERGNVAASDMIGSVLAKPPRPIEAFIPRDRARAAADAARLAWLLPMLRASIAFVWIATGIVSLGLYPVESSYALLARLGLTGVVATGALYGAALLDLALGIGTLVLRRRRWLWRGQAALIIGYSILISIWLPEFWLHPFGPMLKNVPMLAGMLVLHEFDEGDGGEGDRVKVMG